MDVHTILGIAFVIILSIIMYLHRGKLHVQKILGPFLYFAMWRTKIGLKAMELGNGKLRKPVRAIGYIGIAIGFIGMLIVTIEVIGATVSLITNPEAAPSLQPVLPVQAKGVFFVPFAYWIISIFIIAVIHEFAHGIVARAHDMRVQSSGFAFLGILVPVIPAAFVEPDEKQVPKKPVAAQLSMFAAGATANILTALLMIFLFSLPVLVPKSITEKTAIIDLPEASQSLVQVTGLEIISVKEGYPAEKAGLREGMLVTMLDEVNITETEAFASKLANRTPGETVLIVANNTPYAITLAESPDEPGKGIMGVGFDIKTQPHPDAVAKYGELGTQALTGLATLVVWIFALSLGIGIFNLIPLGPIDGGRMLHLVATRWWPKRGLLLWKLTSGVLAALIAINLAAGWIR